MADSYSRVYRIGLLDDLHNYFPELLYNIESFHNVQDVLQYIRTRTTRRFNIFDNAMREYTNRSQARDPFLNPQNVVHRYEDPVVHSPEPRAHVNNTRHSDYTSLLIPLISSLESITLLREPRIARPRVVYEDVVIHASQEIIDQTSRLTTLLVDAEENCSVCQDQMKMDDSVRILGCSHIFHTACIDPWLLNRSALCPTCRHDIREDMPMASQPMASQPMASQPMASQPMASQPMASQPMASQPMASQPRGNDEFDDYDDMLPSELINSLFARRHFNSL